MEKVDAGGKGTTTSAARRDGGEVDAAAGMVSRVTVTKENGQTSEKRIEAGRSCRASTAVQLQVCKRKDGRLGMPSSEREDASRSAAVDSAK